LGGISFGGSRNWPMKASRGIGDGGADSGTVDAAAVAVSHALNIAVALSSAGDRRTRRPSYLMTAFDRDYGAAVADIYAEQTELQLVVIELRIQRPGSLELVS
jgi:hypothetical protein